jgi:DNA modification methylase
MTPYYQQGGATILHGDCRLLMAELPEASIDAIVCDPPYGLEFMGKEWDRLAGDWARHGDSEPWKVRPKGGSDPFQRDRPRFHGGSSMQQWHESWAIEALRVLKPGGYLLAFGGTRTFHRLACAIEDAGFEIRDTLSWLHGQGFPKGHAQLKPAWEPIIMARKPLAKSTVASNVLRYGTGGLNVDGCRIEAEALKIRKAGYNDSPVYGNGTDGFVYEPHSSGRWPANVCLDEESAALLDEMSGERPSTGPHPAHTGWIGRNDVYGKGMGKNQGRLYEDTGGASRFFYCAKASTAERRGSKHPTVKPLSLMRWLVRMVTPPNGTVLDPFAGSGTTLEAAISEGFNAIGMEMTEEYLPDIEKRLQAVAVTLPLVG